MELKNIFKVNDLNKILSEKEIYHTKSVIEISKNFEELINTSGEQLKSITFDLVFKNVSYMPGDKSKLTIFPMMQTQSKNGTFSNDHLTRLAYSCFSKDKKTIELFPDVIGFTDGDKLHFNLEFNSSFLKNLETKLLGQIATKINHLLLGSELQSSKTPASKKLKL